MANVDACGASGGVLTAGSACDVPSHNARAHRIRRAVLSDSSRAPAHSLRYLPREFYLTRITRHRLRQAPQPSTPRLCRPLPRTARN
ncbi:hypothetical protein B0G71_0444 [Paraburkholderia sp. BL27I4N3]|nr:hypothetical protein B0G71_0444 [Paraburkholderia sp. BL27I4N3]